MTKTKIKYIQALKRQKYRKAYNAYLVEGNKNAKEWLASSENINLIAASADWLSKNKTLIQRHFEAEVFEVSEKELQKISALKTAQSVVLSVEKRNMKPANIKPDAWCLYLEEIRDPGNLGTIIRIADWFGVNQILYSENCVEFYNPKVIQATMGSLLRINVQKVSLDKLFLLKGEKGIPVYATTLNGKDVTKINPPSLKAGIVAIGNESKGLSSELIGLSDFQISIPRKGKAESLNAGIATGIICSHLIR